MATNDQTKNQKSFLASLKELATATSYVEDLEPKEELRKEISRISESGYCAGWNIDIEFFVWQAINGGSKEFGATAITDAQIAHLKALSQQSGGWWYWSDDSKKLLFVPIREWQEIYQSFCQETQTNENI